jgi:hypothetical protein
MGLSIFLKKLFNRYDPDEYSVQEQNTQNSEQEVSLGSMENETEDEDSLVVLLAAAIIASNSESNSCFQISNEPIEEKILNDVTYEIEEEEKLVLALAASIKAGTDYPNSHFHISKITRIHE